MPTEIRLGSASSLGRTMRCAASAVLPHAYTTHEAAETGTHIHSYLHDRIAGVPQDEALAKLPEALKKRCEAINIAALTAGLGNMRTEVAYALNLTDSTVRELGQNIGRAYVTFENEVPGTVDMVAFDTFRNIPVVKDFKTGFLRVTECKKNAQMLFAATVAMYQAEAQSVRAEIVYIDESGRESVDAHTFDAFDIDVYVAELRATHERVRKAHALVEQGRIPDVTLGDWCQYCPATHACPANVALVRSATTDLENVASRIAAMTPDEGGKAYVLNKRISKLADTIDENLRKLAKITPLPISDTLELREGEPQTRGTVETAKLVALAKAKGATDEEIESCKKFTTSTQVREMKRR